MDGNEFLLKVGVDTSPAEKDLASFINKINSMRSQAASSDASSSSPQLPPQVASAAFSDAPIDLSKQTSDLKEQAKIQRQIVQDRGKLVGLLQEEARIAGSIDSSELKNIRQGAEDALATAFGSGKLSASLKGALTKAINETVAAVRIPDGNPTRAQTLTAKTQPAPPERFVSRSTSVLKTVGIEAPTVIRPNVDILKDFNKAISSGQGDVLAVLDSLTASFGKVLTAVDSLAGNFASAASDQGKALDDMTSSLTETAKTVGKINDEILKNLADKAKKAAIDSQKTYGARQKEVIKTVVDNPGISYEELKATGAPAQTIQSLTNRGLKRTGDNFDVDVSALTNFDAELTKVLSEFVGPVAGSLTQIQELEGAVKRLVSGVDAVAVEAENTAQAVAQDGLFGEKGKAEPVRKGTVPQDEPAPAKKEKFVQTDFLAQEQTIEDALAAEATVIEQTVDAKEQGLQLQKRANEASQRAIEAEEKLDAYYNSVLAKYGASNTAGDIMINDEIEFADKRPTVQVTDQESAKISELEDTNFDLANMAREASLALESFINANKDLVDATETLASKTEEASEGFGPGTTSRRPASENPSDGYSQLRAQLVSFQGDLENRLGTRVPLEDLRDVLKEGLKTQFETGETRGGNSQEVRRRTEEAWGIDPSATNRPVYGMLDEPRQPSVGAGYGEVFVRIAEDLRKVTMTIGDSGIPDNPPDLLSLADLKAADIGMLDIGRFIGAFDDMFRSYKELQFQDKITPDKFTGLEYIPRADSNVELAPQKLLDVAQISKEAGLPLLVTPQLSTVLEEAKVQFASLAAYVDALRNVGFDNIELSSFEDSTAGSLSKTKPIAEIDASEETKARLLEGYEARGKYTERILADFKKELERQFAAEQRVTEAVTATAQAEEERVKLGEQAANLTKAQVAAIQKYSTDAGQATFNDKGSAGLFRYDMADTVKAKDFAQGIIDDPASSAVAKRAADSILKSTEFTMKALSMSAGNAEEVARLGSDQAIVDAVILAEKEKIAERLKKKQGENVPSGDFGFGDPNEADKLYDDIADERSQQLEAEVTVTTEAEERAQKYAELLALEEQLEEAQKENLAAQEAYKAAVDARTKAIREFDLMDKVVKPKRDAAYEAGKMDEYENPPVYNERYLSKLNAGAAAESALEQSLQAQDKVFSLKEKIEELNTLGIVNVEIEDAAQIAREQNAIGGQITAAMEEELKARREAADAAAKTPLSEADKQALANAEQPTLIPDEVIQPSTETKRNYAEYDALRDIYNDMIAEGASAAEAAEDVKKFAEENALDIGKLQYEGAERIGEAAQYLSDDWLHDSSSEELRSSLEKFAKEADTLERIRAELDFRQENPSELRGPDRPIDVDAQVKPEERKAVEGKVVEALSAEADAITASADQIVEATKARDSIKPDEIISDRTPSKRTFEVGYSGFLKEEEFEDNRPFFGPKTPAGQERTGPIIDAQSVEQEEWLAYKEELAEWRRERARERQRVATEGQGRSADLIEPDLGLPIKELTAGDAVLVEQIEQTADAQAVVEESAQRLSASMDESLTAIKGLTPAMLAVIDILESMPLSLAEFKNSFGNRITSLRALNERGVVSTNDEGKYTVAPREEIPGLFKAASDRKLDYKKSLKTDAIAEAKAEADALIEEYGFETVQAFSDNLEYFTEQYVDSIKTRIETLELTLGDTDADGAVGGAIQIPTPLINKDLYQRFGEVVGAEWDFYVEAFLEDYAPGILNFQGTNFSKSDIDSLLFSEADPGKQLDNASEDIRNRIESQQSRLPEESAATGFEDYLSETPGLREANLSIDEYISQLLELSALSEELRNIAGGLSGIDISTAMGMFGDQLEGMANESVEINEQIAAAARAETEAKLQAIEENRAALKVYKEAFDYANDDDFAELSSGLQEALREDLRQAAANASAVLRSNETILGQASTATTINVDEGKAIDNLIGIQNALENKIIDEAKIKLQEAESASSVAPVGEAQQLLINEVVEGAKIESDINSQRRKNLESTKSTVEPVSADPADAEFFAAGENGLVSSLARKIEALDKQSGVLENIYPSFEEAERELVYALNRKRQLLDQQSKAIEDAGVTLPSISEIDPFQSGGPDGGPKYGVNPYDTMKPDTGGTGGGGGSGKSGLVGEGEDGFDPVEAALARIEAAEKKLLTNIALFSETFANSGVLFADKLAELQAGVQGFNAALEGKTLTQLLSDQSAFETATQGGAEKLAGESAIEAGSAAKLLAEQNETLLKVFVESQKLLASSMQEISEKIFNQSLEADKRIRSAWENAETAFTILTQTNAESGEKLSELFADYTSKLAVFNQELSVLTKEGITSDPELLGRVGEAKGKSRIADTTIAGSANQSIINTILNDPEEEGGERNLVDELLAAQIALIESTSQLAELRNEQILETREVLEQLADEDTSILRLKNAREATAQSLEDNLPAGATRDKLALSRRVEQKTLNLEDPGFIQLKRREADLRSQERRAILGEEQAPGLTGKLTRYFDYQPDRGGAGFKQFFGGGALAAARYGIPGQILRSGGSGIVDTVKEAEELQFALARLEGQFKTVFPDANFDDVRGEIKAVAVETGLAADEIANFQIQITGAFSDVEIGGVSGTDLVKEQTLAAAKLAQTVGLPLTEITDGLTAASLAFGENFQRIGDVAVRLEERSGVLARETIAFIGDIAPVAEEAGYSLEEFAALAAVAQQRSGRSGAALAESFGRVIPALAEQKDQLMELAQITPSLQTPGFIDAIRQSDSKEILNQIGQAYQSMGKDAQQATVAILGGRREAQALIPALANRGLVDRLQKDAENSTGSLDTRFEDIQNTLTNSLARLGEAVRGFGVELLESGLTDVFELAIGLGEKLLSILTPIAGIFADINKSLGGIPAVMTALLGAGAAFNNVAFRPETQIITDPVTGAETSEIIGRQFIGTDFVKSIGESIKENFTENFDRSAQQSVRRNIQQGSIAPENLGPLFAGGLTNDDSKKLITRGQKLKAAGTGLLGTIGGGSAALGAGLVGVTALSTAFGFIKGQIDETQAALDDLILETQNQITDTDLDVDGARERLTENLRVQAEEAREAYDGWTEFFGELGNNLNPGDYLDAQASVVGASDDFRDALTVFESSDSLRQDIFKDLAPSLDRKTGGLRDQLKSLSDLEEKMSKFDTEFQSEVVDGETRYSAPIEGSDIQGRTIGFSEDELAYLNQLEDLSGFNIGDQGFGGFARAASEGDQGAALLKLAKAEDETVNEYGQDAVDAAIATVEALYGLAATDARFESEIDALIEDIGKLPPLESNALKIEELKTGFDVGVISFEEYSSRLIEFLKERREILSTSDQTEASELELLKVLQAEKEGYAALAQEITRRQDVASRIQQTLGAGETELNNATFNNAISNLQNPIFKDSDARLEEALKLIEAQKNIDINMALQANSVAAVIDLLVNGSKIPNEAKQALLEQQLFVTEEWADLADDLSAVEGLPSFNYKISKTGVTGNSIFNSIGSTPEEIIRSFTSEFFEFGKISDELLQNAGNDIGKLVDELDADGLKPEDREQIRGAIDGFVDLLTFVGVTQDVILDFLAGGDFDSLPKGEQDDIRKDLEGYLKDNPFDGLDEEDVARIDYNTAKEANSNIFGLRAAEAKGNDILAAEAKRDEADANRFAAELSKDAGLISQAKQAQIAAERELQQAYSDAQVAKLEYYSAIATINGNLIKAIDLDIQALERQRDLAAADDNQPAVDALNGQIAIAYDNKRKQIVADANALSDLLGGLAALRADLVQAAMFALEVANRNVDAARTPEERAAAALAQAQANADLINAGFAERSRDYDLWTAVFSALGSNQVVADAELARAQDALRTAIQTDNKDDINKARIDLVAAEQGVIRAGFADRTRDYDVFGTFLGSRGFGLEAAQIELLKAQDQLKTAERTGNKDDIAAARIAVFNADAAVRDAVQARADSNAALATALAGDDPLAAAQIELNRANAELRDAQINKLGPEAINAAKIAVINANKARINAQNDIRIAMMGLRQAELQAIEDEVGAAQLGVEIARQQLNDLINANAGDAAIAQGRAALITADKAAKDAVFNERQEEYKWLLDMGRISKSQYINYLEGLKSTLIPGSKQFRDLELAIRQLKNDIGGELQTNLPTSLRLPTLYEIRRADQGTSFSASSGPAGAVGYNDNRSLTIGDVTIASGVDLGQFMKAVTTVLGEPGTSGSTSRRF